MESKGFYVSLVLVIGLTLIPLASSQSWWSGEASGVIEASDAQDGEQDRNILDAFWEYILQGLQPIGSYLVAANRAGWLYYAALWKFAFHQLVAFGALVQYVQFVVTDWVNTGLSAIAPYYSLFWQYVEPLELGEMETYILLVVLSLGMCGFSFGIFWLCCKRNQKPQSNEHVQINVGESVNEQFPLSLVSPPRKESKYDKEPINSSSPVSSSLLSSSDDIISGQTALNLSCRNLVLLSKHDQHDQKDYDDNGQKQVDIFATIMIRDIAKNGYDIIARTPSLKFTSSLEITLSCKLRVPQHCSSQQELLVDVFQMPIGQSKLASAELIGSSTLYLRDLISLKKISLPLINKKSRDANALLRLHNSSLLLTPATLDLSTPTRPESNTNGDNKKTNSPYSPSNILNGLRTRLFGSSSSSSASASSSSSSSSSAAAAPSQSPTLSSPVKKAEPVDDNIPQGLVSPVDHEKKDSTTNAPSVSSFPKSTPEQSARLTRLTNELKEAREENIRLSTLSHDRLSKIHSLEKKVSQVSSFNTDALSTSKDLTKVVLELENANASLQTELDALRNQRNIAQSNGANKDDRLDQLQQENQQLLVEASTNGVLMRALEEEKSMLENRVTNLRERLADLIQNGDALAVANVEAVSTRDSPLALALRSGGVLPSALELSFSCRNLAQLDWLSKNDSLVAVFAKDPETKQFELVAHTERLVQENDPKFLNHVTILLPRDGSDREIKMDVYHNPHGANIVGAKLIGNVICNLSELVALHNLSQTGYETTFPLSHPDNRKMNKKLALAKSCLVIKLNNIPQDASNNTGNSSSSSTLLQSPSSANILGRSSGLGIELIVHEQKERMAGMSNQIETLKSQLETALNQDRALREKLQFQSSQAAGLEGQIDSLRSNLSDAQAKNAALEQQNINLELQMHSTFKMQATANSTLRQEKETAEQHLVQTRLDLTSQVERASQQAERFKRQLDAASEAHAQQMASMDREMAMLRALNAASSGYEREAGSARKQLEQFGRDLLQKEQDLSRMAQQVLEGKHVQEELTRVKQELEKTTNRVKILTQEKSRLEGELRAAQDRLQVLEHAEDDRGRLQRAMTQAQNLQVRVDGEAKLKEEKIARQVLRIEQMEREIESLKINHKDMLSIKNQRISDLESSQNVSHSDLADTVTSQKHVIAALREDRAQLQKHIKDLRERLNAAIVEQKEMAQPIKTKNSNYQSPDMFRLKQANERLTFENQRLTHQLEAAESRAKASRMGHKNPLSPNLKQQELLNLRDKLQAQKISMGRSIEDYARANQALTDECTTLRSANDSQKEIIRVLERQLQANSNSSSFSSSSVAAASSSPVSLATLRRLERTNQEVRSECAKKHQINASLQERNKILIRDNEALNQKLELYAKNLNKVQLQLEHSMSLRGMTSPAASPVSRANKSFSSGSSAVDGDGDGYAGDLDVSRAEVEQLESALASRTQTLTRLVKEKASLADQVEKQRTRIQQLESGGNGGRQGYQHRSQIPRYLNGAGRGGGGGGGGSGRGTTEPSSGTASSSGTKSSHLAQLQSEVAALRNQLHQRKDYSEQQSRKVQELLQSAASPVSSSSSRLAHSHNSASTPITTSNRRNRYTPVTTSTTRRIEHTHTPTVKTNNTLRTYQQPVRVTPRRG